MIAFRIVAMLLVTANARLRNIVASWDSFWFTPADPYNLCLARLLAGGMLFYSHMVWGLQFDAFLGDSGFNNVELVKSLQSGGYAMSFWWYVPENWKFIVHIGCCIIIFMFFIGLFTRMTSVLSWVIAVSYAHRAMLANFGLDQVLTMLVMYLMLAPCGASLSIDAIVSRWRGRVLPTGSVMSNVASRLIQVHLCVIYLFAGISKLQGESWWRGDAVWNALANYEYQSLDMTFLAAWPIATHALSLGTIMWEVSFCMLVWNPRLRPFVLVLGLGMHVGIGAAMGMWTFGLAMTFAYLSFVSGDWLRRVRSAGALSLQPSSANSTSQAGVDSVLVVVCKSTNLRNVLVNYFESYNQTVFWVDDLPKAHDLCRRINPVVICIQAPPDAARWVREFHDVNPQAMFVIQTQESLSLDNSQCRTVSTAVTCRNLRQACEQLLGKQMIKKTVSDSAPVKIAPKGEFFAISETYDDPQVNTEPYVSGSGQRFRVPLKEVSLLLVCLLLIGCSDGFIDVDTNLNRAAALNDLGRFDEALAILNEDRLVQTKHPRLYYLQGVAFEQLSEYEQAVEAYSQCLAIDSEYTDALNNRAVVYGKLKKIDSAIDDLIRAVGSNPNDALAWTNLGLAYHEKGLYPEAIEQYGEAEKRAALPQIPFQMGNAYLALGQNQEAATGFSKAIERDPAYAQAHLNLAIALYRLNRIDQAIQSLVTAESLDVDISLASIAQNLRDLLGRSTLETKAEKKIGEWLTSNGWEIVEATGNPCSFRAQRLPVAGDAAVADTSGIPLPPDEFIGIVLIQSQDDTVACDYDVVEYVQKNTNQVFCWFVLDQEKLLRDTTSGSQLPSSMVIANYDWRPERKHLTPLRVKLNLKADSRS